MTNTEAISKFIKGALAKEKHDRYLSFVTNQKKQVKFLKELDHSIEKIVNKKTVKEKITEKEWNESGYLFSSNGVFGESVENIKTSYEGAPWDGGWLIIDRAGNFGILRPEGRMGDEIYIKL